MTSREKIAIRLNLCAALAFCFIFTSCQVAKETMKAPVERKHTFNASFDRTWGALIKVLSDDGYPFKIMEKSSGILQTDNLNLAEETAYAYSTTKKQSFGAIYRGGTINLKFFVQSKDSITTIQITPYMQATFYVYKVFANVDEIHVLESNGTLEKSLFDKIQTEVR